MAACLKTWRRGRDSTILVTFQLSSCDPYTSEIIPCLISRLQANPIFRYSFYSFCYSLDLRAKRYHWYQRPHNCWPQ